MKGRRTTAAALALLAALPLAATGCGIRPTGIIGAGSKPVSGSRPGPVTLFLLKNGRLVEVDRPGLPDHGTLGIPQLGVPLTAEELRQGLTTQVPRVQMTVNLVSPEETDDEEVIMALKGRTDGRLEVYPERRLRWTRAALAQLACTAEKIRDVRTIVLDLSTERDIAEERARLRVITDEKAAPPKATRLLLKCSAFADLK
ncbi:hypothetical protein ACQEU3_29970 [Spirillospora sp. CA-253888]